MSFLCSAACPMRAKQLSGQLICPLHPCWWLTMSVSMSAADNKIKGRPIYCKGWCSGLSAAAATKGNMPGVHFHFQTQSRCRASGTTQVILTELGCVLPERFVMQVWGHLLATFRKWLSVVSHISGSPGWRHAVKLCQIMAWFLSFPVWAFTKFL